MAAPRFMQRIGGVLSDIAAAVVGGAGSANQLVGTNNAGTIDPTFLPAGLGADTLTVTASEAISAGSIVNLYTNAGATNMRNADSATSNGGKKGHGFVLTAVASGAAGVMYRSGQNNQVTGLTPGAEYYLGASGAVQTLPATPASGTTLQYLGIAQTATLLDVQPQPPIAIT